MKFRTAFIIAALMSLAWIGRAQTIILATTYSGTPPVVVSSSDSSGITTNSNAVTVASGATVTFHSTVKVKLEPGFHAASGSSFIALAEARDQWLHNPAIVDTDGDGIPDSWEIAHGLNPNDASDAQHTAPDGLTYSVEYLLGTSTSTTKQNDNGTNTGTGLTVHHPIKP